MKGVLVIAALLLGKRALVALAVTAAGQTLLPALAHAQFYPVFSPTPALQYYVGLGVAAVHHTGYVPNTRNNAEDYVFGGSVFGGYRLNQWAQVEAAYHSLGTSEFSENFAILSTQRSHAFVGSFVAQTMPLSQWPISIPTLLPTRLFARAGLAYRHVTHTAVVGTFNASGIAGVIGGGAEIDLTQHLFARVEYQYLSKSFNTPTRAINVQHTPLTLSVGGRF